MVCVPADLKSRFFARPPTGQWQAKPMLTALVGFRQHNLLDKLNEAPFDLVFLKNVLILLLRSFQEAGDGAGPRRRPSRRAAGDRSGRRRRGASPVQVPAGSGPCTSGENLDPWPRACGARSVWHGWHA